MDIGKIEDNNLTTIVEFSIGDEACKVEVGYVDSESLNRIYRKATRWDKKDRREVTDVIEANRLLGRAAIKDITGLTKAGPDGNPVTVTYTPEVGDMFMSRIYTFAEMVNETVTDLQRFQAARTEESLKNLVGTSGE